MADDLPKPVRRLVEAKLVTQEQLGDEKVLAMLNRLSEPEVDALISISGKFGSKVHHGRKASRMVGMAREGGGEGWEPGTEVCFIPL